MNKPNLGLEPILFFRNGGTNVKKFWDLFAKSIIIQGILTLSVLGLIAYLLVVNREVPSELWSVFSLIVGFFFGSKLQRAAGR